MAGKVEWVRWYVGRSFTVLLSCILAVAGLARLAGGWRALGAATGLEAVAVALGLLVGLVELALVLPLWLAPTRLAAAGIAAVVLLMQAYAAVSGGGVPLAVAPVFLAGGLLALGVLLVHGAGGVALPRLARGHGRA